MSQSVKTSTRMSADLATFIRGLSENESAATRALLLIGADQLGIDPNLVADDLRATITARLPPEVSAILLAMWSRVHQNAVPIVMREHAGTSQRHTRAQSPAPLGTAAVSEPAAVPEQLDPFSHVGFDFEETA
ncbi:MAG TPA: hypothetical protein VLA19_10570 [Herpetosiphonaceae bacterium]|nr:hypothetical protein [Herpetosiphonaceae bacterium]